MRRHLFGYLLAGLVLFQGANLSAQDSITALEQDLNAAKQQRDDTAAQVISNFFGQVDAAMSSTDAALVLYQQAGGQMPDATPINTAYEHETETEKADRLALDKTNVIRLGAVLELQCGLLHFGGMFVAKPDHKGLQNEFVGWLKSAAPLFLVTIVPPSDADLPAPARHKHSAGKPFNPDEQKSRAIKDSTINNFLAFHAWGDKEQGNWSVREIPRLYRANVLEPLRATPTAETLAAWDSYIAMANAEEKDNDRWTQVTYPSLQFERSYDDYKIAPSSEKLESLVNIIKANPTHAQVDEWIARTRELLVAYRASHGGTPPVVANPAPAPAPTPSNPNVTVTTETQGDMTVVTTHTNSAPTNPVPQ